MLGISISDVTEAISMITEIDSYLGSQKCEIARVRLISLRDKLIQFKSSDEFKLIVEENNIKSIIDRLNIQISGLYAVVYSEEEVKFNPDEINLELQTIATHLNDFRNKIKYQTV